MESDGPMLGLGWRSSLTSQDEAGGARGCGDGSQEPAPSFTDRLMQHHLQQCLQYHEERQVQQNGVYELSTEPVQFVLSTSGAKSCFPKDDSRQQLVTEPRSVGPFHGDDDDDDARPPPEAFARSVEEGRSRAQAILDRFRHQQQNLLFGSAGENSPVSEPSDPRFLASQTISEGIPESIHFPATSASALGGVNQKENYPSVALFVEQRTKGLQREAQHKHRFLLRNLAYVARREEQRAKVLANNIEASKSREAHAQEQYSQSLLERQRLLRESTILAKASKAAIGSRQRLGVEKLKQQSYNYGAPNTHRRHDSSSAPSASLYLSGIPVDGSVDESFLRRLFEPYASIRKVHLYRDKVTGHLKGDGLIVYQLDNDDVQTNLLSTVCSQMNGVELPCGSVLNVEPAYGTNDGSTTNAEQAVAGESVETQRNDGTPSGGHDDDALDEFFNSL